MDTGAQCNVLPLKVYKKATKDMALALVTHARSPITAYGGSTLPVVGTVLIQVWRGDFRCRLDCKLVDRDDIRPLLGRKACIGMKIVSYLNNDAINKPVTGSAPVYAVENAALVLPDPLLKKHRQVQAWGFWKASITSI